MGKIDHEKGYDVYRFIRQAYEGRFNVMLVIKKGNAPQETEWLLLVIGQWHGKQK